MSENFKDPPYQAAVMESGLNTVSPVFEDMNFSSNTSHDNQTANEEVICEGKFCFIVLQIIQPTVFGLITLTGTLGNSLVIYVILSRKKMRTVTNLLLLNLAIADLSFVIICPPFTAYQYATNNWPIPGVFGSFVCKLMHYLLNVTVYVTIYTLVLISAIRYMTIVHNNQTMKYRTRQNIILAIVGIWIVVSGLNVPIIMTHGIVNTYGKPLCNNYGMDVGRVLYALFFAFAYVVPLTAIAVLSICILLHIQKQRPVMLGKRKSKSAKKKRQAARILIIVVVIFAILWLPINIFLLVAYFHGVPENAAIMATTVVCSCLAYFNSCVNPFIYNYASKDFRESFREVACCVRGRKYVDGETSFYTKAAGNDLCHNGQNKTTITCVKEEGSDAEDV